MAFVFDSAPNSVTANSYISVSDADDILAGRLSTENWDNLSTTDKEALLVQATNRLDAERYAGLKGIRGQSLQWPRQLVTDRDSYVYNNDEFPRELLIALCEQAMYFVDAGDRTISNDLLEDVIEYKVGPIQWKLKGGRQADQLPQLVQQYLKAIGSAWFGKSFPSQSYR